MRTTELLKLTRGSYNIIYWLLRNKNTEKQAINSKILQMQDMQGNVERHHFNYIIPKVRLEKCSQSTDDSQTSKDQDSRAGKTKRDLKELKKEKLKKQCIEETLYKQCHQKTE